MSDEIRCKDCDKLLAIRKKDTNTSQIYFEVRSKHDKVDVAFPCGKATCKCGKVWMLNPFTPYTYSLPLDELKKTIYNVCDNKQIDSGVSDT